jgi:hypothetical protein
MPKIRARIKHWPGNISININRFINDLENNKILPSYYLT